MGVSDMNNYEKALVVLGGFLVAIVLSFGLVFLLWSFMHADFNYQEWGGFSRTIMVIISVYLSVISCCAVAAFFDNYTELMDFDE